ncbi:5' nucleotidase, NT5C type, partial [Oceanihabitans sediminis]|uniref:5' nucleotidase, NT5C type n=1 Tax=Oceanihabitans sediminis TaxID=1812012 RepID=UPI00299E4D40
MKVGLDIDDVICNLCVDMIPKMNKRFGTNLDYRNLPTYNVEQLGIPLQDFYKFVKNECDSYVTSPPMRGASEITKRLIDDGHEVYLITARSNLFSRNMVDVTRSWLAVHNISYTDVVFDAHKKKGEIAKSLGIKAFLDDRPEELEDMVKHGVNAYLF